MCGEKRYTSKPSPPPAGSPPRVRGKALPSSPPAPTYRITPACAGKRHSRANAKAAPEDHPRVCGEKAERPWAFFTPCGSPPRVRGKALVHKNRINKRRITPACAGKSCYFAFLTITSKDHPRVCGEKRCSEIYAICSRGSPPRVRGKDAGGRGSGKGGRITPACAGKSCTAYKLGFCF